MRQTTSRIIAWLVVMLWFITLSINAQSTTTTQQQPTIERKGNTFIQKSNGRGSGQVTKTNYIYQDSKGNRDTIYISPTGKCFVFKLSKNGNIYKRYLPEITKQLQEEGKIDEKH